MNGQSVLLTGALWGCKHVLRVQAWNLLSKYCVFKIQVRLRGICYEELAGISIGSIVCH
jgi:hypothetical protein